MAGRLVSLAHKWNQFAWLQGQPGIDIPMQSIPTVCSETDAVKRNAFTIESVGFETIKNRILYFTNNGNSEYGLFDSKQREVGYRIFENSLEGYKSFKWTFACLHLKSNRRYWELSFSYRLHYILHSTQENILFLWSLNGIPKLYDEQLKKNSAQGFRASGTFTCHSFSK